MRAQFEADQIPVSVLPIRSKNEWHPRLLNSVGCIARKVRDEKFSILHAHSRATQVIGSLVSRQAGIPMVSTAHGFFKPKWGRRLFPAWGRRVIAVSPSAADDLILSHRVPAEKVRVVLNAIDQNGLEKQFSRLNTAQAQQYLGLEGRSPVLASVGRFVEDKGHHHLIEAVAILKRDYPDIHLVLVGDGREKARLEGKLKSLGLSSHVSLAGAATHLAAFYKACDIFVHPATFREGFGLTIAEAMFAGKPVVATRIPALDRLLRDGENALLVPPASAEALAQAVRYLWERPNDRKRIAESGSQWARATCDPWRFASEVEAVYREVLL